MGWEKNRYPKVDYFENYHPGQGKAGIGMNFTGSVFHLKLIMPPCKWLHRMKEMQFIIFMTNGATELHDNIT